MIQISCKTELNIEFNYVCKIIFEEFLRIEYLIVEEDINFIKIKNIETDSEIHMPSIFFQFRISNYLSNLNLPKLPLHQWDSNSFSDNLNLINSNIPIIYGDNNFDIDEKIHENLIKIPIDIFGSIFFMLSRFEEFIINGLDTRKRFSAFSSTAFKANFLSRPIVDEYVEILYVAIKKIDKSIVKTNKTYNIRVSCDVDIPFAYNGNFLNFLYRTASNLFKYNKFNFKESFNVFFGNFNKDPYYQNIYKIMTVNEKYGNIVTFNFIPICTDLNLDTLVSIHDKRIVSLIKDILSRGHKIGIHPGYNTYNSRNEFANSVKSYINFLKNNNLETNNITGRQHYLRWEAGITPLLWDESGLSVDSTLGYSDYPGFRCGTCHEFIFFDIISRKELNFKESPLIVMETTIISEHYLGLGYTKKAQEEMQKYKNICKKFNGSFTFLWHNSNFSNKNSFLIYENLISNND